MIAMQRARVRDVGSCNACVSPEDIEPFWVYEVSLNHLVFRLCSRHFREMVELRKAVR